MSSAEVMSFPCELTIKVMGNNQPEFIAAMLAIFREHCPDLSEAGISTLPSKTDKFLSLSVTVNAKSKAQMDELYEALTSHELSLFVL